MQLPAIETFPADIGFIARAVSAIRKIIDASVAADGECVIGLSGGSTPKPVYAALAKENIDWQTVRIFLIDERHIGPDHPDSNQKMIRETLCKPANIPEKNILFPDTRWPVDQCIAEYETRLKEFPAVHLAILGMGDDGHIASLFPPLAAEAFGPSMVIHTQTDRFAVHDRISVTVPFLQHIHHRLFLSSGIKKKEVIDTLFAAAEDVKRWPAQALFDGRTAWMHVI